MYLIFSIYKWIVIKFQTGKRQIEKWDKLHSEQSPSTSSLEVTWGKSAWLLQVEQICNLQLYNIDYIIKSIFLTVWKLSMDHTVWFIPEPSKTVRMKKTVRIVLTDVSSSNHWACRKWSSHEFEAHFEAIHMNYVKSGKWIQGYDLIRVHAPNYWNIGFKTFEPK